MATRVPRDLSRDALVRANLRRFREEAELSQQDLALRSGVPLDAIRRYESGARRAIDAIELRAIAIATGHEIADFFLQDPPPANPMRIPVVSVLIDPTAELPEAMRAELDAWLADFNNRAGPLARRRNPDRDPGDGRRKAAKRRR